MKPSNRNCSKTAEKKKIDIAEPQFKPKHRKKMPKKYFKHGYNGFEPKSIEFKMFYKPVQYIGMLNIMLRLGEHQKKSTKRTQDNYCIIRGKPYRYGDTENRINIRRRIIRYTNTAERNRQLRKDEIVPSIGYIEYRYDRFASEIINEKVIEDAIERMKGIEYYKNNQIVSFASFINNDRSREGLRMTVFILYKPGYRNQ